VSYHQQIISSLNLPPAPKLTKANLKPQAAQRYGKGRAAEENHAKPPNLIKKRTLKPITGAASHLTDLLGLMMNTKPTN